MVRARLAWMYSTAGMNRAFRKVLGQLPRACCTIWSSLPERVRSSKAAAASARSAVPVSVRGPLKVAIVGFGTVGRSVAKVLSSGIHPSLQLTAICNRGVERKKVDWVPPKQWRRRRPCPATYELSPYPS